jgi:Zn-dependent peptidase ImmA (M78 family)
MMGFVYTEVERVLKKYRTRDPYALLDAIGAVTVFSDEYDHNGLKGFCAIMNRTMYAVVNDKLCDEEKRVVAGHEAFHLILHKNEIKASPVKLIQDFDIYNGSGRYEREANAALADFLVSDEDVMDIITDEGKDFINAASELYLPPPLFAFKLYNMAFRGYELRNPMDIDSGFLGRNTNR